MADITPIASLNGELAMPEKVWMQGPPGPQGPKGDTGAAATVTVGTVTTGEHGTDAIVTNSGTENAAVFNFTIPRGGTGTAGADGKDGAAATVTVGTVTTGEPGTDAIVTNSGTESAAVLNFTIPRGETGPAGAGVPDGGTVGQLLGKTETGTAWIDPPQSGVQPDWNQNDATQPDYVKNRPFYTGNPVETVRVEESTIEFVDSGGIYNARLPSTFEATAGNTYKVYFDENVYECTCVEIRGTHVIGNLSIIGAGSDTGEPFLMAVYNGEGVVIYTKDTSASHTLSISEFAQEIVKINGKYLPNSVATKSEVEAAQITADKNKEMLSEMVSSIATFTFDKITTGRYTFLFNDFTYYKISDFRPSPEDVISFTGTRENGEDFSRINAGNNCVEYGLFIIILSAGACELPITETVTYSFSAPSAGLYARYKVDNTSMTAGTGQFTLMSIDGLTIKSSTYGSNKKFRITVDDTGTISATEVT